MRISSLLSIFRTRQARDCIRVFRGCPSSSYLNMSTDTSTNNHMRSIRGQTNGGSRLSRVRTLQRIENLMGTPLSLANEEKSDDCGSSSGNSNANMSKMREALHHVVSLSDARIAQEFISKHLLESEHLLKGKVLTLAIQALGSSRSSLDLLIKVMKKACEHDSTSITDIHITAFLKAAKSELKDVAVPGRFEEVLGHVKSILQQHKELLRSQIALNAYVSFFASVVKRRNGKATAEDALVEISKLLEDRRGVDKIDGSVLNSSFYAPLISICGHLRKFELAEKYHEEMTTIDKSAPTSYSYNALMSAAVAGNHHHRVVPLFEEMISANIQPKAYSVKILMNSLRTNDNDSDRAFNMFKSWMNTYESALDWVLLDEAHCLHNQIVKELMSDTGDRGQKRKKQNQIKFLQNLLLDSMYAYAGHTKFSKVMKSGISSSNHHQFPSYAPPILLVQKVLSFFALSGKLDYGLNLHYKLCQEAVDEKVENYGVPEGTWIDISNAYAQESRWKDLMHLRERLRSLSFSSPPSSSALSAAQTSVVVNIIAVLMKQDMFLQAKGFLQAEMSCLMDENGEFDVTDVYKAFQQIRCDKLEVPIFFALMKSLNIVTRRSLLLTIKNCRNARQLMACIDYSDDEVDYKNEKLDGTNSMKVPIEFDNEHIDAISACLLASNPEESHTIFDCLENKYSLPNVLEHVSVPVKLKNSIVQLRVNA